MNVQNFIAVHPIVIERIQSGQKWRTNSQPDQQTLAYLEPCRQHWLEIVALALYYFALLLMKPNLSLLHLHSQPTALHHKEFPGECPHEKLSLSTCRGLTRSSDWTPTDGKQKKIKSLPLRKPQAAYTCNTMNSRCKPPTSKIVQHLHMSLQNTTTQQNPAYTKESHSSILPFDASSSNLVQVKASPWKGFASKPGQISLSAYQPQIYSALLRYSLRELGIIAEVMTVMMSLYLSHVECPPSSLCLPLSNFPYLSNSPHINIHFYLLPVNLAQMSLMRIS